MDLIWLPILICMTNLIYHILSIEEHDCMCFVTEETKTLLNFKGIVHLKIIVIVSSHWGCQNDNKKKSGKKV